MQIIFFYANLIFHFINNLLIPNIKIKLSVKFIKSGGFLFELIFKNKRFFYLCLCIFKLKNSVFKFGFAHCKPAWHILNGIIYPDNIAVNIGT